MHTMMQNSIRDDENMMITDEMDKDDCELEQRRQSNVPQVIDKMNLSTSTTHDTRINDGNEFDDNDDDESLYDLTIMHSTCGLTTMSDDNASDNDDNDIENESSESNDSNE